MLLWLKYIFMTLYNYKRHIGMHVSNAESNYDNSRDGCSLFSTCEVVLMYVELLLGVTSMYRPHNRLIILSRVSTPHVEDCTVGGFLSAQVKSCRPWEREVYSYIKGMHLDISIISFNLNRRLHKNASSLQCPVNLSRDFFFLH